jgi:hypothetical protein
MHISTHLFIEMNVALIRLISLQSHCLSPLVVFFITSSRISPFTMENEEDFYDVTSRVTNKQFQSLLRLTISPRVTILTVPPI